MSMFYIPNYQAVFFDSLRIAYVPILKAANTSIKFNLAVAAGILPATAEYWLVNSGILPPRSPNAEQLRYFTFTFVRNPFERMVSCWQDKIVNRKVERNLEMTHPGVFRADMDFPTFVRALDTIPDAGTNSHLRSLVGAIGKARLDFVGRCEQFYEDWHTLASKLRVPTTTIHANKTRHRHYREYYDPETKDIVAKRFRNDITQFRYEF